MKKFLMTLAAVICLAFAMPVAAQVTITKVAKIAPTDMVFMDMAVEAAKTNVKASSKKTTDSSGKPAIKVSWSKSKGYSVDKYIVYMSTKKSSGYEKAYTTKNGKQTSVTISKDLKKGKTYYFKVRAARKIEGKTYYTNWSNIVSRKVTS